ncbi:MAG TPA: serine hydrolase domain-containing protein [Acidobacteriota bacterium]|nr:serine hydrolase domain-containing protein [Acidobacteriota bacterium]
MRRMNRTALLLALLLWTVVQAPAQDSPVASPDAPLQARIETEIRRAMIEGNIPSMTVALVSGEEIVWTGAYGYSNLWAKTPAVTSTVYLIGSTFKSMSTAVLLGLMEQGKFQLDDPVSQYLGEGLSIRGEDPENPITFRHLLTHVSGLPGDFGAHAVWGDTVPDSLEDYLKEKLRAETPPLEKVVYSNMAYTLIAHLVEEMTGREYRRYVQEKFFDPLEMKNTVFKVTPQVEERLAIPYALDGNGNHVPTPRLKAQVWPAGIVYGTVEDQAHWLITVLNGGRYKDNRILSESTVEESLRRQWDQFAGPMHEGWGGETGGYGLTWWTSRQGGERIFAHSGSVPGYTAFLQGNADRRIGIAILSNGHRAHRHLIKLSTRALEILAEE